MVDTTRRAGKNSRSATFMFVSMAHKVQISSAKDLGAVVRATRKWQRLRQDEVGGFSHTFIGELEGGKPTAQLGKVLEALRELGIKVQVELPPGMSLPSLVEQRSER